MQVHKKFLFYISQNYSFAVLRPIQKQILARGDECIWFVEGNTVNHQFFSATERVVKKITEVIDYCPDAVFVPGNIVPSFIPGLKIQVWHGLPSSKAKNNGQLYHYIIRGMFDLYCTQGPDSTRKFKVLQAQYKTFQVIETGWSKLDSLFQEIKNQATKESKISTQKSIFFASTFSPRFSKAQMLYPHIIKMINKYDFNWYITLHPKMNQEIVNLYRNLESQKVTFVEPTELDLYFQKADMMLCDTSSIIYEFLTQLKPVVTFQTETVDDCLINVENINELEKTILEVLGNPEINQKNIRDKVSLFHPYIDGQSSQRILQAVDQMLAGQYGLLKKKPYNFLRNFKLRKILNYWKW